MTAAIAGKALLPAPALPASPSAQLIVSVARDHGVSPFKQFGYMITRYLGPKRLNFQEYYDNQLYRPALTKAEKDAFVGQATNFELNSRLTPKHAGKMAHLIKNKALYSALLGSIGLSSTQTQAVATRRGSFGNVPALKTPEAIAHFLRADAVYPLFGKPASGSRSIGSALIASYDAKTDTIKLGNGKEFDVAKFAAEIHADYPAGFLLQTAVKQHKAMTDLAGPALGSVRIVTVNDGTGPRVLYTLWKVPSPAAMSDNFWQAGSMLAGVDTETGKVVSCVRGTGPSCVEVAEHPVSKKPITGFQMPHWEAAKALAVQAHDLFPEFGVFGWDMGIGQDGPVVVECNTNPFHTLYQLAFHRGVKNPDFKPILDRVIAFQKTSAPPRPKRNRKNVKKDY